MLNWGFGLLQVQGQDGFPITPLGNDGVVHASGGGRFIPPRRPRHSRRPLAGIHVGLGFRAAAGQGQGGFPITPLGNDGVVARG